MIKIIEFGAPWCPACSQQEPLTKEFCEENDYEFEVVNVDEGNPLTETYTISTLPTIIVLSHGSLVGVFTGFTNPKEFAELISGL